MCLNEAYPAFLRRICRGEYTNFGGFLFTLVLNIALDVRDKIIRDESAIYVPVDDPSLLLVDQGKKAPQIVADRELREIMEFVLTQHAKESTEGMLSASMLSAIHEEEFTWKHAADVFFPEETVRRSLKTRIRLVKDLEHHDMLDLCRRLKERGVTNANAFEL